MTTEDAMPADDDLHDRTTDDLRRLADELDRRRPGAPVPSVGMRPHRRPWTYRDIWRREAIERELRTRGASDDR